MRVQSMGKRGGRTLLTWSTGTICLHDRSRSWLAMLAMVYNSQVRYLSRRYTRPGRGKRENAQRQVVRGRRDGTIWVSAHHIINGGRGDLVAYSGRFWFGGFLGKRATPQGRARTMTNRDGRSPPGDKG